MNSSGKLIQFLFKKMEGSTTNRQKQVIFLTAMIPLVVLFTFVISYHVDFFVWDELALVPFWEKLASGNVGLSDWLKPHNDHQILFPKLVMVGMLTIFNFQVLPLLVLTIVFAFTGYRLIWKVQIQEESHNRLGQIAITAGSFLFFSLLQWENFLRFWQIQLIMCIVFFIWSSYFLFVRKSSTSNTVLSLIFAGISTFSFGNGIIGLVVNGFLLFFDASEKEDRKKKIIIYLAGMAIIVLLFFTTFSRGESGNSMMANLLPNLAKLPVFFLFFIGQVIVYPFYANKILAGLSLGAGFAGLLIFLFNAVKLFRHRKSAGGGLLFLFALSLWVLLSGAVIAFGRIGFGLETSVSSRYASFSALFWVANLSLFLIILNSDRFGEKTVSRFFGFISNQKNKLTMVVVLVMLAGAINSFSASWRFSYYERTTLPALSEYYKMSGNHELLLSVYPDSTEFSKYPAVMARIGITPFNNNPVFPYEKLDGIISSVVASPGTSTGKTSLTAEYDYDYTTQFYNMFQGKISGGENVVNTEVLVELKNGGFSEYYECSGRNSKKDTAPGFFALIPFRNLAKGEYVRRILVKENGQWNYLPSETSIIVK